MTGRPDKLDQVVGHDEAGEPVTVHDRIVGDLRVGTYMEHAAGHAGVSKQSVYQWMKDGANAYAAKHRNPRLRLTAYQRRAMAFSDAVAEAQAEWWVRQEAMLERLARGGHQVVHTTVKLDGQGREVERSTRTETLGPSERVLLWRMERKAPHLYGRRVELVGPEGGPVQVTTDERAQALGDTLRTFLAGADAGAELASEREVAGDG